MFKIGDKVKPTKDALEQAGGQVGTVVYVANNYNIAVEFPEDMGGHACGGRTKRDNGWWYSEGDLINVSNFKFQVGDKVVADDYKAFGEMTVVFVDYDDTYHTQPYLVRFNSVAYPSCAHNGFPFVPEGLFPRKCLWFSEEDLKRPDVMVFDLEKFLRHGGGDDYVYKTIVTGSIDAWPIQCDGLTEEQMSKLYYSTTEHWMVPAKEHITRTVPEIAWLVIRIKNGRR